MQQSPTAAELNAQVVELQAWLRAQTFLPQCIAPTLLRRYLHTMRGDLTETKRLLELNYTLRNKHPHIFLERDPLDESSQKLLQIADLVPLPGLTPEHNKLLLYRLIDFDAEKFNFTAGIKVFFMVADCRFALEGASDNEGSVAVETRLSDGEIPIFDMAGYSLRHLTKTVLSSLRVYMKFVQEAHPVRLRAIHVLNCPTYLDKVLTVVKPFIKSEVFKLIHFHLPNAETPYEHFPRAMMPEEYGGAAGKMADLKQEWCEILKAQRAYLMDGEQWRTTKCKRGMNGANKTAKASPSSASASVSATASETQLTQSLKTLEID